MERRLKEEVELRKLKYSESGDVGGGFLNANAIYESEVQLLAREVFPLGTNDKVLYPRWRFYLRVYSRSYACVCVCFVLMVFVLF